MSKSSLFAPVLLIVCLPGCKSPAAGPADSIVSDGPAPATVTLRTIPPQGASHTLDFHLEVRDIGRNRRDVSSMRIVSRIESVTPASYVESSQISGFQMLQNDFRIDAAQQKQRTEGVRTRVTVSRAGDFLSGNSGDASPVSYHLPEGPVRQGDTWQGWAGVGAKKQPIQFSLVGIVHSKGHDLALISYAYTNARSEAVSVREWSDVQSGWLVRAERTSSHSIRGVSLVTTSVLSDPLYER